LLTPMCLWHQAV